MKNTLIVLGLLAGLSTCVINGMPQEVHHEDTDYNIAALFKLLNPTVRCAGGNARSADWDPIQIDHIHLPFETCLSEGELNIRCTQLKGLSNIVVNSIDFSIIRLSINFNVSFPLIRAETSYDFNMAFWRLFNIDIESGIGVELESVNFAGGIRFTLRDRQLVVQEFIWNTEVESASCSINGFPSADWANTAVTAFCQWAVQEGVNQNILQEWINAIVVPIINDLVADMTFQDIIDIINNILQTRRLPVGFAPTSCDNKVVVDSTLVCDYDAPIIPAPDSSSSESNEGNKNDTMIDDLHETPTYTTETIILETTTPTDQSNLIFNKFQVSIIIISASTINQILFNLR